MIVGENETLTPQGYIRIHPMKSETEEGTWRWGRDTATEKKAYIHPRYMPNKRQWSVFEWQYLDERGTVKPTTVWNFKDVNSERGTEMFEKFLGFNKLDFPNPKPVGTIERILQIATDKSSIILDSFAGSGTTAHAVLNLNKQDGGKRKFILIEMMDYAETITAERVRRVITGYGEGKKKIEGTGGSFAYYELGDRLLNGEYLNEDVGVDAIRQYVYFTETKQPLPKVTGTDALVRAQAQDAPHLCPPKEDEPYYLGSYVNTAYYFYYEREEVTTLSFDFLKTIKTKAESYLIYADLCTLSEVELTEQHITFRKIPRDIKRI